MFLARYKIQNQKILEKHVSYINLKSHADFRVVGNV